MAEPAPQWEQPDNSPGNAEIPPPGRPDLRALEGGGQSSPPTGRLNTVSDSPESLNEREQEPDDDYSDGYDNSEESEDQPEDDRADLLNSEEKTEPLDYTNQVGSGYKKSPRRIGFLRKQLGKHNRIFLLSGSSLAITLIITAIFLFLAPSKILQIVNNLQNRFYATGENAVQKESDVLMSNYLRKYVFPALRKCPSNVNRTCNPITEGGMVSQLYKGWRNARLEERIKNKYGIEFQYNQKSGRYYLKTYGMTGLGADATSFAGSTNGETLDEFISKSDSPQFKIAGRGQVRQAYRDAMAQETKWKQVYYRFKVGRLLEKKYGIKRCIIACTTRDNFADWKDNKKRSAKMIIAERVLLPRSEALGLVIQCILDDTCDPSKTSDTDADGRKQSPVQARLQQRLSELRAEDLGKYDSVLKHSNGILDDGYKKYILKQIVKSLGGEATSVASEKVTSNLIPVIGWVNAASSTIGTLEKAPAKIRALSYTTNAVAMVSLYATYRTYADESKTGNVDLSMIGSFTDSLGPGDKNSTGGPAGAEQTPLYQSLMGNTPNQTATSSFVNNFLSSSVYADSNSSKYICSDGKPVPAGKLVCQEEVLGGDNGVSGSIQAVLDKLGPVRTLADFWNHTAGYVLKKVINTGAYIFDAALSIVPGYGSLLNYVTGAATRVIGAFTDYIIPSPFSDHMGGGRTVDMMAGGADASGNDFAQNGLGAKKLTAQQASLIVAEQQQQQLEDYKNQPLMTRLFDRGNSYSLASKAALALPTNWSSAGQSIANVFSNPFAKISGVFGGLFTPGRALAANQADPFGIDQYGYPSGDAALVEANKHPDDYWNNNCTSDGKNIDWNKPVNKAWQDNTTVDQSNGQLENDTTDPCLLIQAAVGSAGAVYDSNLLTDDDLQGSDTSPGSEPSDSGTYQNPFRDVKNLSAGRIDQGVDYGGSGPVYAIGNGKINYIKYFGDSGWPPYPGTFINYTLTDGAAAGKSVYFSENCGPPAKRLAVGEAVSASTVICNMINASPHIEIGWSVSGQGLALAHDVYNEGHATAYGRNFSDLLQSLHVPGGTYDFPWEKNHEVGSLPAGWPKW